jgi:hypothetical protein
VDAYLQCMNRINVWVYVILIKKHEKFLYSDQQSLKKLKTNEQLLNVAYDALLCMHKYLALVGIYHH